MQLNYFDSIFENTSQTIIIINETGSILRVNSTIEKILGYKPDELVSENIAILMPAEQARQHHVYIQRYLETGKSNIVGQGREIIAKHKDGRLVTLFISISELQTPHGRHFIGIIFDLSELSLARESIKLELNLSRELATIQEMYIQKASAKELFNRVLTTLLNTTGSKYGFIGLALLDQNKKPYLKTLAITNIAWNKETHEFYEKNAPNGLEFTNLNTLFGHTLRTGETVITNDPKNHPASGGLPKGHPPLNRYMGIPIYGHNGLIAMAGIANSEKAYSEETLKQISPFIRIISSIIVATRQALELEKLAKTDALTQVANRNHFEKFLAQALAQAKEKDSQPALLLLDLNKFKGINDSYGHPAGDFILSVTAMRIREEISSIDLVARLGGDEFAVILSKPASKTEVGLIAQRIQDKTSQPIFFEQTNLQISVSIGVSCFPLAGKTTSTLLKHADIALYRSKKDGLIRFFDEVLETAFYRGQAIKAEVLKALRNKKIELHIQPIFNLSENEIEGGEILLRWNHPKLGTISPAEFIPLCEEIDAAKELNLFVIEQAAKFFESVNLPTNKKLKLHINLTPYVKGWPEHIVSLASRIAKENNLLQKFNVYFEVTESQYASVSHRLDNATKSELSEIGIQFALDDFGTRYSSFNRVLEYPCKCIKIDVEFTRRLSMKDHKVVEAIFRSIKTLCSELNIHAIVEGVETKQQKEKVEELGFNSIQGYYFYKPIPLTEFIKALTKQNNK